MHQLTPVDVKGAKVIPREVLGATAPNPVEVGMKYVGKTVADSTAQLAAEGITVVSVIRGEHMLAPRPDLTFTKGDRLILVANPGDLERAWHHMTRW